MRRGPRGRSLVRGTAGWRAKRATDVIVTAAGLGLVWPLMALLALAVRLSSPGPVLLRQERIGLDGNSFDLLKFRSMRVHVEGDTMWSVAPSDPRVTRLGRLMRRSALDELPQLVNVLKGEMSLVGPRPERPYFANQFDDTVPGYAERHRVRGGLTGWAQIHGWRGDTSITQRTRFDLEYIEHWSLRRDIAILMRTIPAMARDAGRDDAPPVGANQADAVLLAGRSYATEVAQSAENPVDLVFEAVAPSHPVRPLGVTTIPEVAVIEKGLDGSRQGPVVTRGNQ
jgi:lipopolysaccharide/colanic/teichoic acid biosynthesis glycosyltransferase